MRYGKSANDNERNGVKEMKEIYRLTVRTVDGARFISDYEEEPKARIMMEKFFVTDRNLLSFKWTEGQDKAIINLDKVASANVRRIRCDDSEKGEFDIDSGCSSRHGQETYVGSIHIEEAS